MGMDPSKDGVACEAIDNVLFLQPKHIISERPEVGTTFNNT